MVSLPNQKHLSAIRWSVHLTRQALLVMWWSVVFSQTVSFSCVVAGPYLPIQVLSISCLVVKFTWANSYSRSNLAELNPFHCPDIVWTLDHNPMSLEAHSHRIELLDPTSFCLTGLPVIGGWILLCKPSVLPLTLLRSALVVYQTHFPAQGGPTIVLEFIQTTLILKISIAFNPNNAV